MVAEINATVEAADKRRIAVVLANFQWQTSSKVSRAGVGFPTDYINGYAIAGLSSPDHIAFWQDLYTNQLRGFTDCWEDMAQYHEALIDNFDSYENVIAYEILNEPQTTRIEDYANMGAMNKFIADRMRVKTTKGIMWCRDNALGSFNVVNTERTKLVPGASPPLIHDNHSYSLARMKNYYVPQNNAAIGGRTDVQTFVGEWAFQTKFGDATSILDLDNMKFVLNLCKANGYAIAYWALGVFAEESGNGNFKKLCNPDGTLRQEGRIYSQAVKEIYG